MRAERQPQQGRTLIRSGKDAWCFNGGQCSKAVHILQYVTGWVVRGSENLNFGKQSFRRFGILLTVPAGMLELHSFATRTAVDYAVGVGRFMLKQTFRDFVFLTNTDGSGKAASYVRAIVRGESLAEIANQRKDDVE